METAPAGPELAAVSAPARVARPGEGISAEELVLASRNHALPLEALRDDVTPPGLHYVLTHYDIPPADDHRWRLSVGGLVRSRLSIGTAELRAMPATTVRVTLECAGNGRAGLDPRPVSQPWLDGGVGTADWTGVPLRDLLHRAGPAPEAVEAVFTGADHGVERGVEQDYRRSLPMAVALDPDRPVLVAHTMNGAPLPPQHGRPLRLVVPGWYGMASVKWLCGITLTDTAFAGYQQAVSYRYRQSADDPGEPVTLIAPRALLVPPGFPDFLSRTRVVRPGPVRLEGRAWSGRAPVTAVEVSTDGGTHWESAVVEPAGAHPWAWRRWHHPWTAVPGRHLLTVRATDADGNGQPSRAPWNRGGFGNNLPQAVEVVCAAGSGTSGVRPGDGAELP
ncbi:sulfite oxidase [Kitasatospora sp. NBC_01539]|uniref:sulfite oxidase n=1 Tax=Kitasatospora sp. NBC_01539 TaxID=2903577 RepID=UPI0038601496